MGSIISIGTLFSKNAREAKAKANGNGNGNREVLNYMQQADLQRHRDEEVKFQTHMLASLKRIEHLLAAMSLKLS